MPQRTASFKPLGLYTYGNQFSAPDGAMSTALDIYLDRTDVIEVARAFQNFASFALDSGMTGMDFIGAAYSASFVATNSYYVFSQQYNNNSFVWGGLLDTSGTALKLVDGAGTVTTLGQRVLGMFEANRNIYIQCAGYVGENFASGGPAAQYRIYQAGNFQKRGCGMPEAPMPTHYFAVAAGGYQITPTGASPPTSNPSNNSISMVSGGQRAYRVVFAYRDSNGTLVRGAPSGRHVVYAPGANYGIQIFGIGNLYPGDIVQLYASEITAISTTSEPSDDMRLVYEYIVQSADVTRKYIGINDAMPDNMRGPALYTNDTQQGILMAEQPPPPAAFACWFKDVAWYSGVSWPGYSALVLNILATSSWGATTTITINGVTYTASTTTENPSAGVFMVFGGGSTAQNRNNTVKSLCRAINYNNQQVLAAYSTPPNGTVATITLKYFGASATGAQGSGSVPGTCSVSATNAGTGTFSPSLDAGAAATTTDGTINRLYYSKPNQPEAVPELSYVSIGPSGNVITGMGCVRDSLFVFTTSGLFRVTGTNAANIVVELFDETVKMAPGLHATISAAGNQLFALTNQGVVSVTESGVSILSFNITDIVSSSSSGNSTSLNRLFSSSGSASDTEKKYFLKINPGGSDRLFAYNFIGNTWVEMSKPISNVSVSAIKCVRRAGTYQDAILASNATSFRIHFKHDLPSSGSDLASSCSWTYTYDADNPLKLKRFYDLKLLTAGSTGISTVAVTFSSDSGASPQTVTVTPTSSNWAVVQVPPAHALAGQLTAQFTITTNNTPVYVSEVQATYDETGDWVAK